VSTLGYSGKKCGIGKRGGLSALSASLERSMTAYLSDITRTVERRGNTPDSFTSSFT
jgi:hypothetical protein